MQDRRLVLVVQGDEVTTYYQMWLETPCDDHGQHVLTNRLCEEPGITAESPHVWVQQALEHAQDELCLCGAAEASPDALTAILEATRA